MAIKRYLDAMKGSEPTSTGYVHKPGGLAGLDELIQSEAQARYDAARARQNANIASDWVRDYNAGGADKAATLGALSDILEKSETPLGRMISEQGIDAVADRAAVSAEGWRMRNPLAPNTIVQAVNQPFGNTKHSGVHRALAYSAAASGATAGLTAAGLGLADLIAYIAGGTEQAQARETSPVLAQKAMEDEVSLLSNPLVARINDPESW